jgi:hypothetical protein
LKKKPPKKFRFLKVPGWEKDGFFFFFFFEACFAFAHEYGHEAGHYPAAARREQDHICQVRFAVKGLV